MASRRSPMDRLLARFAPRPIADFAPPPQELAPGVWGLDRKLRFPGGAQLPSRTTIVRSSDGALTVLSPPPLLDGAGGAAAIDALGVVRHVVAPNTFHYVYAAECMARYPRATLLVAPGLPERVPELPAARELGPSAPPDWPSELEFVVLGPVRGISEVIFFHRPSGTLILSDLAFHLTRFPRRFDRVAWRLSGIPAGFGPGRTSRSFLLRDAAEASRCLGHVAEWPIQRIVVAHGDVVEHDARAQFMAAFAPWLVVGPPAG